MFFIAYSSLHHKLMISEIYPIPEALAETYIQANISDRLIVKHDESMVKRLTIKQIEDLVASGDAAYEYLQGARRLYFDIENLAVSSYSELDLFIFQLIEDFSSFYQIFGIRYLVTLNLKSRHPGASMHIITDIYVHSAQMLRDMVRLFVRANLKYKGIIDVLVYNDTQYMRMPYSRNALKGIVYKEKVSFTKKLDVEADDSRITVVENRVVKTELDEPEANKHLNELIRHAIHAKNEVLIDEGADASALNDNDFHFIYKSTYDKGYDKSLPFIISDIRDCTLYSNRFPHIVLPIDEMLESRKFDVKMDDAFDSGCSYDMFVFHF